MNTMETCQYYFPLLHWDVSDYSSVDKTKMRDYLGSFGGGLSIMVSTWVDTVYPDFIYASEIEEEEKWSVELYMDGKSVIVARELGSVRESIEDMYLILLNLQSRIEMNMISIPITRLDY